ncbi:MAG: hypothetical protein WBF73_25225, partial [Bradyrhizobium sp.]
MVAITAMFVGPGLPIKATALSTSVNNDCHGAAEKNIGPVMAIALTSWVCRKRYRLDRQEILKGCAK